MELIVVGNRAGMPAPGAPSSGYVVRTPSSVILMECGPGVASALPGVVRLSEITAVLVSHMHADHCYDLLTLGKTLVAETLEQGVSRPPIPLYVQPGGARVLRALNALFPVGRDSPLDHVFDEAFTVVEYPPDGAIVANDVTVRMAPVRHAVPCSGFRLETAEASLAFSGDTGPTDALVRLAANADVLLCEATLREPDRTGHGHLSAVEAGALAAAADVGQLVLTHLARDDPEWVAGVVGEARATFPGPVSASRPGYSFAPHKSSARGAGAQRRVTGWRPSSVAQPPSSEAR